MRGYPAGIRGVEKSRRRSGRLAWGAYAGCPVAGGGGVDLDRPLGRGGAAGFVVLAARGGLTVPVLRAGVVVRRSPGDVAARPADDVGVEGDRPVAGQHAAVDGAPVFAVTEVSARTVPTNCVPVPSVAELPTCQNTLHGSAPLIRLTVLSDAVIRVVPAWKMNTASGLPWASRVRVPVSPSAAPVYTPASRVWPAEIGGHVAVGVRPAASL